MQNREPDPSDVVETLPSTLDGFILFCYRHYKWKEMPPQLKYLKYSLSRLCREFPEEDPREFLLEFLAKLIYEYEKQQRFAYNKHTRYFLEREKKECQKVKRRVREAIERLEQKYEKVEGQAEEGTGSPELPQLDDRVISAIERGWRTL